MSSLFSNHALKRSFGASSVVQINDFRDRSTVAVSAPAKRRDASVSATDLITTPSSSRSLEELLYEARAQAKIHTAQVAMHMDDAWRRGLYAQLDNLLDRDEWFEGDLPLGHDSYATFIRLMLLVRPTQRPGLGLSAQGKLIASWQTNDARLSIECLAFDQVRYVLSHHVDGEREAAAGDTILDRILIVLTPYGPDKWFTRVASEAA